MELELSQVAEVGLAVNSRKRDENQSKLKTTRSTRHISALGDL